MIKNSLKQKQREWDWQQDVAPDALSPHCLSGGKVSAVWRCRKYLVLVTRFPDGTALLTIADRACRHNWQDMQRIKNDVLGKQWAGVEVYPPQRLVVDYANFYHLWCTPRKLRIGWDDGGDYTVEHTFYTSKDSKKKDGLPEITAAQSLKDNQEIIKGMLEDNNSDAIHPDLTIVPGGNGEDRSAGLPDRRMPV